MLIRRASAIEKLSRLRIQNGRIQDGPELPLVSANHLGWSVELRALVTGLLRMRQLP
jgi:hypothetical protein